MHSERALENARQVVEYEDWLRRWPQVELTKALDERARKVGLQLTRAPEHVRERNFERLWWIRFNAEPVVADLVRVGIPFDEAYARMEKRLRRFEDAFNAVD